MPIEHWNTRKSEPTSQAKRELAVSHGDDRVLQHARVGEPLQKGGPENQRGENHGPAGQYNGNAPYRDPKRTNREKRCKANDDTCMGWAGKDGYCGGHSHGWSKADRWGTHPVGSE